MEIDEWNVIHTGLHPRSDQQLDRNASHSGICTHIGQGIDTQAQNFSLGVYRKRCFARNIAPMCTAQKLFAAVCNPFDRFLQLMGSICHHYVFRIGARFHTKAATDITHDDAHLLCW